jgi:hypothetical protein
MRLRDAVHRLKDRLRYPPPLYKRVGGMSAVVRRADGRVERLGTISDVYAKRWGVSTHGDGSDLSG